MNTVTHKSSLENSFEVLLERFRVNYEASLLGFEQISLHQLRVAIKRLRAFCAFMAALSPGFQAEQAMGEFREIFKRAGGLRDLHIKGQILRDLQAGQGYDSSFLLKEIEEKEEKRKLKFIAAGESHRKESLAEFEQGLRQRLRSLSEDNLGDIAADYFRRRVNAMREYAQQEDLKGEALHRFRILFKEFYYNLGLASECIWPEKGFEPFLTGHNNFQELLGNWHDLHVFRHWLEEKHESGIPEPEKAENLLKVLEKEEAAITQQIDEEMGALWKEIVDLMEGLES